MRHKIFLVGFCLLWACHQSTAPGTTSVSDPHEQLQRSLATGWNTWKNPSVLSHVLLPQGFAVNIKFRKTRGGPYWLDDAYISNKDNIREKIEPGLHAYDGSYTELTLNWEGQRAKIRTAANGDDFVLVYTPLETPSKPHLLLVETAILWNKPGYLHREDQGITGNFDDKKITLHTLTPQNDEKLPLGTPYFSFWSGQEVILYTGAQKTAEAVEQLLSEKKAALEKTFQVYGELSEAYEAIQTLHAWNTIYDARNDRVITPVSRVWNEVWAGYVLFDWDTYFSAMMLALDNPSLAFSNAIAITDEVTDNGFIPNVATGYLKSYDRSQPPVGSLACKMIYDKYPERWFLERVYPNLLSWNRWWDKHRNNEGFLSWGSDPHPNGLEGFTKQGAKWESGLDNSPLFDEAVFNEEKHMLELASAGLMGLYVADCQYLAEIADILGKAEDAAELRKREARYAGQLAKLWNDERGIYQDWYTDRKTFSPHLAPTHFYPLIARVATDEQADRMISEHFMNEQEFMGTWIMPSIARNDPGYPDNSYWRGRVWAPMNFLVYLGLKKYDQPEAVKILSEKSLALILKSWREEKRVYENYNSSNGVGGDVRNSTSFYSWGGLLGLIALMEQGYFTPEKD